MAVESTLQTVEQLAAHIKSAAAGEPIYYVPNRGNAGDSVITWAAISLFKRFDIDYRYCYDWTQIDPAGKVVVYGGGGNLIDDCYACQRVMSALHDKVKRFILLPHTVVGHGDFLRTLGDNVDLFCRELRSLEYLQNLPLKANVLLAEDLVFAMDVSALRATTMDFVRLFFISHRYRMRLRRNAAFELRQFFTAQCETLHCVRTDGESTNMQSPEDNVDLSAVFAYGMKTELAARCASYRFCKFIDRHQQVETNRLHVGIVASLLGKQLKMHPNSYFKNQAIFELSMQQRFPNSEWMGE